MINLSDINTDQGCLQYLILAECKSPGYASYNFNETKIVMRAMKSVITNRKALNKNWIFCSVNSNSLIDYICAPISQQGCQSKQFNGFTLSANDRVDIDQSISNRIDEILSIANNSSNARQTIYANHVNEAISVSKTVITDPYISIPENINGENVLKSAYGWRTSGSGSPGGNYIEIPQTIPPLIHPNGNIQGIQFFTLKKNAASLSEREFIKSSYS
jgi:hypothetical protein